MKSISVNKQVEHINTTLEIIFSSIIAIFLLVASTELSQNVVFAAVKANSTNMMITDTDTKMMMNGFTGMSLNNKTGTMTMNNAQNGMMLMLNNKTGLMVMMNPGTDTITNKTGFMMKADHNTGITMIVDKKTGMILDPQTGKMLSQEAGKMAMQNESGMMMGRVTMKNMMNDTTNQSSSNGSNISDLHSNNTVASSAMNMNSSSMTSMLERGNIAMGFNQSKIMHHFVSTPTGGEINIVALNSSDAKTIGEIRSHVIEIQKDFSEGNFSKPFYIHAQEVPGTKIMAEKKDLINYSVQPIKNGYKLVLTTSERELIAAIKQFMVFQASQHSGH